MPISRIISGGQTGADRGGLDAALYCNVPHGGWCPKGRRAEDGVIPAKYLLQESKSASYTVRTEANVRDSDATVVFTLGRATGGSLKTLEFCQKHKKPYLHVDVDALERPQAVKAVVDWLEGRGEYNHEGYFAIKPPVHCDLNVAGSRESKADGIEDLVMAVMVDVLRQVNEGCKGLYPVG